MTASALARVSIGMEGTMSIPRVIYFFGLVLLACAPDSSAQTRKPMTTAEIATYMGRDREQLLYAGAKA